jgi:hypothetical protein
MQWIMMIKGGAVVDASDRDAVIEHLSIKFSCRQHSPGGAAFSVLKEKAVMSRLSLVASLPQNMN